MNSQENLLNNTIDLFDTAFRIYRNDFTKYLRVIVILFMLFSPLVIAILFGEINTERPLYSTFLWLLQGSTPPGSSQPIASIVIEISLFSGTIPWFTASFVFSFVYSKGSYDFSFEHRKKLYLRISALIIFIVIPVIFIKSQGADALSDIIRLLFLFTPCILIIENASIKESLAKSITIVIKNPVKCSIIFLLSIVLVRFILSASYVTSILFLEYISQKPIAENGLRAIVPLISLSIEAIFYPAAHIFVILSYYDLVSTLAKGD